MSFSYHEPYVYPLSINAERYSFRNPYTIENRKLSKKTAKRNAIDKIIKGSLYDANRVEPIPFINAVEQDNFPKIIANTRSLTPIRDRIYSIDGTDPPSTYLKCTRGNSKKNITESESTAQFKKLPPYYLDWEMDIKNMALEAVAPKTNCDDNGLSSIPIPSNTSWNQVETKNCETYDIQNSSTSVCRKRAPSVSRRRSIRKLKKSLTSLRNKSDFSLTKDSNTNLNLKSKIHVMKLLTPDKKELTKREKSKISKRNSIELSKLKKKFVKLNEVQSTPKTKRKKSSNHSNVIATVKKSNCEKQDDTIQISNRKTAGSSISVSSSCKSILREKHRKNAGIEIKKKVSFVDTTKLRDNNKRKKSKISLTKIPNKVAGKRKANTKERHKFVADKKRINSNNKLGNLIDPSALESELIKCEKNDEPIHYKSANLMANLLSRNMHSNDRIKTKVLKILSQNHFKDFLDLAVQQHSTALVCERLHLNSMLDYIRRKSKKNPTYRSSFLKGIVEILKLYKSEIEQVKFIENLFDKWTFSDSIVLDLFTKWVQGRKNTVYD